MTSLYVLCCNKQHTLRLSHATRRLILIAGLTNSEQSNLYQDCAVMTKCDLVSENLWSSTNSYLVGKFGSQNQSIVTHTCPLHMCCLSLYDMPSSYVSCCNKQHTLRLSHATFWNTHMFFSCVSPSSDDTLSAYVLQVLHCAAVYRSVLQCVAVCCSAWRCLLHMCCRVLQCVAVCP